jgi:hypothetical protein
METNSGPPKSISPARARQLKSLKPDGKAYKLWADVEEELQRVLPLHESAWVAEAPDLKNETLLSLIRHIREGNREIFNCLLEELMERIVRLARHWVAGIKDEAARDYILSQAEMEILKLALTTTPTRTSDYLEIAFAKKVRQMTFDAIRKYKKSPSGRRGDIIPMTDADEDLDEIERPMEFMPTHDRSPETITLHADLVEAIRDRVEDPRHFEAAMLHWGHGWPVSSKDPNEDTLVRYFNVPERQINYWLKKVRAIIVAVLRDSASPAGRSLR